MRGHFRANFGQIFGFFDFTLFLTWKCVWSQKLTFFAPLLHCKVKKRYLSYEIFQQTVRGHFTANFGQMFRFFDVTLFLTWNCVWRTKCTFFAPLLQCKLKNRYLGGECHMKYLGISSMAILRPFLINFRDFLITFLYLGRCAYDSTKIFLQIPTLGWKVKKKNFPPAALAKVISKITLLAICWFLVRFWSMKRYFRQNSLT